MIQINNELRDRAYQCACEHGFHETEHSDAHWLMLIVSEMAEAVDADRKNRKAYIDAFERLYSGSDSKFGYEKCIKGSVEEELADIVIRCLDLAGNMNIDIDSCSLFSSCYVNSSLSLAENIFAISTIIYEPKFSVSLHDKINRVIASTFCLAELFGVDLLWHIEQKMKYNELRPMLNGKKY
jgi:NTP pyrophosphatase (non-canonical NTP hydrolase)